MESGQDFWAAKAMLDWQIEMGVDETICNAPIDRYALEDTKPAPKPAKAAPPPPKAAKPAEVDVIAAATAAAQGAQDLGALNAAMAGFEHCTLAAAARNLIFSGGTAGSAVMIITDAPDRNDDRAGTLFSARTGTLFDKMIGAIGLDRSTVYMAPVVPWNPPQPDPNAADLAMMVPFLKRHIALAAPKMLVLMGNGPCQALLGRSGMTRMRGTWVEAAGLPALPMFAPSFLLTNAEAKRDAWADLLALKSRLKDMT